jgi:preprotein translocase subunit YajC
MLNFIGEYLRGGIMLFGLLMSTAQAQTAPGAQPSGLEALGVPFILMFAVMYFFIIRPQAKRQKDHQKFLSEVKRGDEVVTSSGILGKIEDLTEQFVTLEVSAGVKIKMLRSQIAASQKAAVAEGKK